MKKSTHSVRLLPPVGLIDIHTTENCHICFCKILLKLQFFSVKETLTCKFCRKQDIGFTQRVAYLEKFLLTYLAR